MILFSFSSCARLSGNSTSPSHGPQTRRPGTLPQAAPRRKSGGHGTVAPPVPIPNTEVKRCCADDSWTTGPAKVGRRQIQNPLQTPPPKRAGFVFSSLDHGTDLSDLRWQAKQAEQANEVRLIQRSDRQLTTTGQPGAVQSTYRKPFELSSAWQSAARPSSSAGASVFSGAPETCSSLAGLDR